MAQLPQPYMTTGKTIALTIWTFVSKVMSLLFNMLSRFVIAFLPRSKHLLISWLQSLSAVILELKKIKSVTVSTFSPFICHDVMGPNAMILVFWTLSFKPVFFTLLFHLHQEALLFFFTFYFIFFKLYKIVLVLPSIKMNLESFVYLRLLIYLLAILIQLVIHPAWHFTSCTLHIS